MTAPTSPTTWLGLISEQAAQRPDGIALVDGERTLTWPEFDDRVRRIASALTDLGIGRGDIVGIWLPNCLEWFESAAALAALGATALGVNTKLRSHDVAGLLERSGCSTLITHPGFKGIDFLGMLSEIDASHPDAVSAVVTLGIETVGDRGFRQVPYAHLLAAEPLSDITTDDPQTPSNAFTSSGSSGVPKIIMHTQASVLGHSAAVAEAFGYHGEDVVVLAALPMCGVFGLNTAAAGMCAGAPVVLQDVFEPAATAALIAEHRVTHSNMADGMLRMLLDTAEASQLGSLREIGFGNFTATDVTGLIREGDALGVRFFQTYGSSEVQALMTYPSPAADAERRTLGGGVPVSPRTEVRIAAEDGSREGEIMVRGPFVSIGRIASAGYETTPVDAEGWFGTGDLGYMAADRDVVYLNRMGDVLRLGGFLVSPREVEDFLIELPGIREAQFVAVEGSEKGLRPVAFVIPEPGEDFDEAEVLAACKQELAGFKVPKRIVALEEFPVIRGANGDKIQRSALRDAAAELLDHS